MTKLSESLLRRYYASEKHPYRIYEERVDALLTPSGALLDAGCGRTLPVLKKYIGRAARLIGVDLVDFADESAGIETIKANLSKLPLPNNCVDLIISRSVFEHLTDPEPVYGEFARILRPGGAVVFLTPNMWDYGSLAARLIPNNFHGKVVKYVEGRDEEDTFPIAYKTNSKCQIKKLAYSAGFSIESFEYLSQYPNYLLFNGALFFLGMCYEKLIRRFEILRFLRGWLLVTLRKPAV